MTRKTRRLWLVIACVACLGAAAALMLKAFSSDIVFFVTPSQVVSKPPPADRTVRLGGMVVAGSVKREKNGETPIARFEVTDGQAAVTVRYEGILPDLFREGQSVVAVGTMRPDGFSAGGVRGTQGGADRAQGGAEARRRSGKGDGGFGPPPRAESWNTLTGQDAKKNAPAAPATAP